MNKSLKIKSHLVSLKIGSYIIINQYLNKQNIIMLHTGRCGSTVLGDTIHQNPKVSWEGEPFEPFMNPKNKLNDFYDVFRNSRKRKIAPISLFAIKHLNQLHLNDCCLGMSKKELIESLKQLKNTRFILLERKNYLKRALSAEVARNKKQWHAKKTDTYIKEKVNIKTNKFQTGHDFHSLIELFDSMSESYSEIKHQLQNENFLELTYEDDILENPINAYKKVCKFLDIPQQNVGVKLKKTNPYPLKDLIKNYDEVHEYLKPTKYGWMLDD